MSANGNGNSGTETSNLNNTWLRGVQETDDEGVVIFETLVPGHYTGRTNVSPPPGTPPFRSVNSHNR